ncbi:MAG: YciC family protein [bacterium]|nr:YciC family protein [bacterium]
MGTWSKNAVSDAAGAVKKLSRPGELLGSAVAYYRVQWRRLTSIVAIYAFGGFALQLLFQNGARLMAQSGGAFAAPVLLLVVIAAALAGAFLYLWGFTALLKALRDERLTWQGAYQEALVLIGSYALLVFLYALLVGAGFFLLVIPGFIAAVWFSFAGYVLVFEEARIVDCLRRSREYVRGRFWAVAWRHVAIFVMAIGAFVLLSFIFEILALPSVLHELLLVGASAVVAPITSVYVLLLYRELKSLHNGKNSD